MDMCSFKEDLKAKLHNTRMQTATAGFVHYDRILENTLNEYAHLKMKKIVDREHFEWYSDSVREKKRQVRRLERRMKSSRSEEDKVQYQISLLDYQKCVQSSKEEYYTRKISECGHDHKKLYALTINRLLENTKQKPLPSHTSGKDLCDQFVF